MKTALFYFAWLLFALEGFSRLLVLRPQVKDFNRIYFTPLVVDSSLHESRLGIGNQKSRLPIFQQHILWISDPDHFDFSHVLNLYGFRGDTFPVEKAPEKMRVLFIGDSFMEGFGADDDHTIPRLVEQNVQQDSAQKLEAINLGVGATGLDEYTNLIKVAAPLLKPDVVVVAIYQNDLPATGYKPEMTGIPVPILDAGWHSRFLSIMESVRTHAPIPTRFHKGRYAFFRPVPDATNPFSGKSPAEVAAQTQAAEPLVAAALQGRFNPYVLGVAHLTEESLKVTLDEHNGALLYLRAIKAATDNVGAKLLLVYIPLHVTVSDFYYPAWNELGQPFQSKSLTGPDFHQQQAHLQTCAQQLGIEFVDTTPRIEELERTGKRLYHRYDSHMNADGYQVVANLISARLSVTK